jgi:NTP pyrophosphatase (non-canonical NTP hydrolase)
MPRILEYDNDLYAKAKDAFGEQHQAERWEEETLEALLAFAHRRRGRKNQTEFLEELGDVLLTTLQLIVNSGEDPEFLLKISQDKLRDRLRAR